MVGITWVGLFIMKVDLHTKFLDLWLHNPDVIARWQHRT